MMKGVNFMNEIKGISCEAKNCIHHQADNSCNAGHITVGNTNATTTTETKCETFKCSSNCNCK
ncbi:MAG: DUF1540 domain-containing protein [Clostridiales bacterium]|nr:DUF1540 domain-containing protein [Clostridiales bacterium]